MCVFLGSGSMPAGAGGHGVRPRGRPHLHMQFPAPRGTLAGSDWGQHTPRQPVGRAQLPRRGRSDTCSTAEGTSRPGLRGGSPIGTEIMVEPHTPTRGWNCTIQNATVSNCRYVQEIKSNILQIKPRSERNTLTHYNWGPFKNRSGQRHTQGRACEDSGQQAAHTPRREVSGGTRPAHTWVGLQPPGLGAIKLGCLSCFLRHLPRPTRNSSYQR